MSADVQAIVLGGGVDALVAAHYLARAGLRVRVLHEAHETQTRPQAGWIPFDIVRDLELDKNGLRVEHAETWAAVALPAGGTLALTNDIARSAEAVREVSPHDAAKWPEFCRRMQALAGVLEHLYSAPPPDPLTHEMSGFLELARDALRVRKLGRQGIEDLLRFLPMSVADLLDEWFESDALKGVLGAAGVMHLCQGPRSGGTAFNFLHHHVGSPPGVFRPPLSDLHRVLSALPGVELQEAAVAHIDVRQGRAAGVVLGNGDEIASSLVVSGAHPKRTLLELVDPGWLDPQLVRAVRHVRSRGVVAYITLTLDRDPRFSTLVVAPSLDYLERAYDAAKYGRVSSDPYIEARHEDAPEGGRHRVHVHLQYAPHALRDGTWDDTGRTELARLAVATLANHVPGFAGTVIEQATLTPQDLEQRYGYPEGQAYHAEIALDQMLWMRPVPELARYRTPIEGLYLCGPAMHPGGGIAGAAGANAASVILGDVKRRTKV